MKKPLTLIGLILVSTAASSTESISINQQHQLIKKIASKKIDANITTPEFIQYIQPGKRTPSCSIVLQNNEYKVIFFEPDDNEDYSNCSKIYPAITTKIKEQYYAAYKYSEEETRGSFIDSYVVMSLEGNNFHICQNQEKINSIIKKSKTTPYKSLNNAIKINGCS